MSRLYTRSFLIAVVSQTFFMIAWTASSHYARWIAWLGGDESTIGWVTGVGAFSGVALRPWIGLWVNRLGARVLWAAGYLIFVTSVLANVLLHELGPMIYVLRCGLVIGASVTYGASLTYITQNAPPDRRTEAIGTFGLSGFTAMLIGPRLGDHILGVGDRTHGDFQLLFWTISACLVAAGMVLFLLKPTPREHRSSPVRLADFVRSVRQYWPGSVLIVQFVFGICLAVPFVFLSHLADDLGLATEGRSPVGRFFFGYAIIAIAIRVLFRRIPDRFGRRKILILGLAMETAGMGSFLLVTSGRIEDLLLPGILCGAGHGFAFHTMTALTLDRFPVDIRGTGSALALMVLDIGTVAGAPVLGMLANAHGYGALFIAAASCAFAAAIVFTACSIPVWVARARERAKAKAG
jgi:MFS family permease